MDKISLWREKTEFYNDLQSEGQNIGPLLDLVKTITASEYAETFYPSISMDTLCISMEGDYKERLKSPMISVAYLGEQIFKVKYWTKPLQTHNLQVWDCHISEVWSLLESLFLRLKVETDKS